MFLLPKKLPSSIHFAYKNFSAQKMEIQGLRGRRRGAYRSVCGQLPSERNAEVSLLRRKEAI